MLRLGRRNFHLHPQAFHVLSLASVKSKFHLSTTVELAAIAFRVVDLQSTRHWCEPVTFCSSRSLLLKTGDQYLPLTLIRKLSNNKPTFGQQRIVTSAPTLLKQWQTSFDRKPSNIHRHYSSQTLLAPTEVIKQLIFKPTALLGSARSRPVFSGTFLFGRVAASTMRDLVNISALSSTAGPVITPSPKKPETDLNRNTRNGDEEILVGSTEEVYQEAVRTLNTLQSNAKTLDEIRKNRDMGAYRNIPDVIDFASRIGISLDRLDDLSCIHVAGTKGKGSVCAFTESILRSAGFKTGFYSSPHLVEVRERIRIDGKPLPKEDFAKYFFTVYNKLKATKEDYEGKMPPYFRFLTLMAFHTFLEEKVDVAIIEVGIGGEYDCTNIIRKPVVVGITSLGMDHIGVLGNTIEKIAWQKAGIIKMGRPAFTVPQPGDAISVIKERAKEKNAPLHIIPNIATYGFHGDGETLGLAGRHQYLNAALALQLAKSWVMEERPGKICFDDFEPPVKQPRFADFSSYSDEALSGSDVPVAQPFVVPPAFEIGLKSCYWAGRNQVVRREKVTYFLDGAHTPRSIAACVRWFQEAAETEAREINGPIAQILVFNSTGERDEYSLLPRLVANGFHGAVFCPNIVSLYSHDQAADTMNYTTTTERQLKRCQQNMVAFERLQNQLKENVQSRVLQPSDHGISNSNPATSLQNFKLPTTMSIPSDRISNPSGSCSQSGDGRVRNGSGLHQFQQSNQLVGMERTGLNHIEQDSQSGNKSIAVETSSSAQTSSDQFELAKLVKLSSIQDALQWAACCKDKNLSSPSIHDPTPSDHAISANHIQILVTGSIHLVGGVINVLDPKLALEPHNI